MFTRGQVNLLQPKQGWSHKPIQGSRMSFLPESGERLCDAVDIVHGLLIKIRRGLEPWRQGVL